MKKGSGGTDIYCPSCESIQTCKANTHVLDELKGYRRQRRRYEDEQINLFERGRECLRCTGKFITAEIIEDYLLELLDLRKKSRYLDMVASRI